MAAKRKQRGKGPGKEWMTTSEAARYLGVSVDTVRQLDESGQLRASRTKGRHRRFPRKALDAYLAKSSGGTKRTQERPKPRSRPVARPEPVSEPLDDDPEDFEPGDEEFEPFVEAPPPPALDPLEKFAREMAERRKREELEARLRRLATLKQYGLNQVSYVAPDAWRAKVAAALESFVTLESLPAWISDTQAYAIIRGKVEEVLQPYHDEAARTKAEDGRREEEAVRKRQQEEEEAREERRLQELLDDGMRYARRETPSDWEFEDRARALRDIERMLKDDVEADWTEEDVKDAVDDELDERADDDEEDES